MKSVIAIILGTSHYNDYGLIRSLSKASIPFVFIMKGKSDVFCLTKSKYLKDVPFYKVTSYEESYRIIESYRSMRGRKFIISTNDSAAEFIDAHELELCDNFVTPMRGGHIGKYFNKIEQCKLAISCGLLVPKSIVYHNGDSLQTNNLSYPLLTKPLESSMGSKSDIHICKTHNELKIAINGNSNCKAFIIQEYIEKDYEINALGVRSEHGIIWGGAIKKIRHYPSIVGSATYAKFHSVQELNIDTKGVEHFLEHIGYYGLFSVEFLKKGNNNYFMEVNMRNDGLCYTSTCANRNLPALYIQPCLNYRIKEVTPIYMMNILQDFKAIIKSKKGVFGWLKQLFKTKCFLDFDSKDIKPFVYFILKFIFKK